MECPISHRKVKRPIERVLEYGINFGNLEKIWCKTIKMAFILKISLTF